MTNLKLRLMTNIRLMTDSIEIPSVVQEKEAEVFEKIRNASGTSTSTSDAGAHFFDKAESQRETSTSTIEADTLNSEKNNSGKIRKFHVRRNISIGIAAAFAFFCILMISNPVLAEDVPVIDHIFAQVGEKMGFAGDYSDYAKPLSDEKSSEVSTSNTDKTDSKYSKTVDGNTITLSEVYCNDNALYVSMEIKSKDKFPDTLKWPVTGKQYIFLDGRDSTISFSFYGNPVHLYNAEVDGEFLDENTYIGVFRFPFKVLKDDPDANPEHHDVAVPKDSEITASLHISEIYSYLPVEEQKNESGVKSIINVSKNWWVEGPWDFEISAQVDSSKTIEKTVGNAEDYGVITLKKSPFEITADYQFTKPDDYAFAMLDQNGKLLLRGGIFGADLESYPIADYDTSEVTVYVFDYNKFFDDLKGKGLTGEDMRTLYDQNALWKETVDLSSK